MFVKPAGPRHTVSEEGVEFVIRIPAWRNFFVMVFLMFWLCGWAAGEASAVAALVSGHAKESLLFLAVWLTGWTIGGTFALLIVLWQLKGREVIRISPDRISVRKEILGAGLTKEYDLAAVRQVRLSPMPLAAGPFGAASSDPWKVCGGWIAFDYGAKTTRFCIGVDEAEARTIFEEICQRLPESAFEDGEA